MNEVIIRDKNQNLQDWKWLIQEFGPIEITGKGGWRVIALYEEIGPANINVYLYDKSANEAEGVSVLWCDPQHEYEELTNEFGRVGFALGGGSYYKPPNQGPNWVTVDGGENSETIRGLGMIGRTNHRHLNISFQYLEPNAPELPPPPDCEEYHIAIERIREIVEGISPNN